MAPGFILPAFVGGVIGAGIANVLMPFGPGTGAIVGGINSIGLNLLLSATAFFDPITAIGGRLGGAAIGGLLGAAVGAIDLWRLAIPGDALLGALLGGLGGGITGLVGGATLGGSLGIAGIGLGNTMDEVIQAGLTRGDNAPAKPAASVADFM